MAASALAPTPITVARTGWTGFENMVTDEALEVLSGAAVKCLLFIIRRTTGFHATRAAISLSTFTHGITRADGTRLSGGVGLSRPAVVRALGELERAQIIGSDSESRGRTQVRSYWLRPSTEWCLDQANEPTSKKMLLVGTASKDSLPVGDAASNEMLPVGPETSNKSLPIERKRRERNPQRKKADAIASGPETPADAGGQTPPALPIEPVAQDTTAEPEPIPPTTPPPSPLPSNQNPSRTPLGWPERAAGENAQAYYLRGVEAIKNKAAGTAYVAQEVLGVPVSRESILRVGGIVKQVRVAHGPAYGRWGLIVRAICQAGTATYDSDPLSYVHKVADKIARQEKTVAMGRQAGQTPQGGRRPVVNPPAPTNSTDVIAARWAE